MIRDDFGQIPDARFEPPDERSDRGAHVLHDREKINPGPPTLDEMKLMGWIPNAGHTGFSRSPRRMPGLSGET